MGDGAVGGVAVAAVVKPGVAEDPTYTGCEAGAVD